MKLEWRLSHTLLGLVDELDAVLEELAGHVEDLLHLVRHCELFVLGIAKEKEVELALVKKNMESSLARRSGGLKEWLNGSRKLKEVAFGEAVTSSSTPHQMPHRLNALAFGCVGRELRWPVLFGKGGCIPDRAWCLFSTNC